MKCIGVVLFFNDSNHYKKRNEIYRVICFFFLMIRIIKKKTDEIYMGRFVFFYDSNHSKTEMKYIGVICFFND